jgi:hypothetical protein
MVENRASQAPLPMTGRSRGIVVPFRRPRPDTRRMPSGAAETAKKPVPCLVRFYESRDVVLNADWNRLITLVAEAWCWRDPDCVAAIEACLAHLRHSVDHDWS